jgi:hypothetical protein
MKQPDERAGFWIKSTQVRSLVRIAVVAGKSQVFVVVCSAMLASNDVLDVVGEERLRVLRKVAVFAAMIGTFTDGLPKPLVHQAARPSAKSRRAFACRMATKFPTRIIASYSSRSSGVKLPSVHLPASSSILPCISVSARRRSTTRRSVGQDTARQPQARAPKQFALNRPAYSEE